MLTVRLYPTNFLESTIVRYDDGRNPAQLANICILPPSPHTIYISKYALFQNQASRNLFQYI